MKAIIAVILVFALIFVSGCIGQAPAAPSDSSDLSSDISDVTNAAQDIQPEDVDFSVDFG